ncbi:hypothetical protein GCM10017566_29160 [Amycolatopsis bartoniae]|uniref:Uncharacterized protein n=2 Tax=Amycolatopsis bartoniae TaxID=941986 RepID=A0A8H9MCG0_9PSEU|nr:hypothetical protein GCM10017566_29160 [Amycolatopsis bartoniae]
MCCSPSTAWLDVPHRGEQSGILLVSVGAMAATCLDVAGRRAARGWVEPMPWRGIPATHAVTTRWQPRFPAVRDRVNLATCSAF